MKYSDIKENYPMKKYVVYKLENALTYFKEKGCYMDNYKDLRKTQYEINGCSIFQGVKVCKQCGSRYCDHEKQHFCLNRLCPICARRRSLKYIALLIPVFEELMQKGYIINFLTLTIKDTEKLSTGLNLLNKSWRVMTHEDKFSRSIFKRLFDGGIRNVEVKIGENSKQWHPHMHLLVVKKNFSKDYDYIKSLWEKATRQVAKTNKKIGSVHIECIKTPAGTKYQGFKANKTQNGEYVISNDMKQALLKAVCETVKYITKFNFEDYSYEDINELIVETKNKRFMNAFGLLFNLQKYFDTDCEEINEDEVKKEICSHCGCTEFYFESCLVETTDSLEEF